MSLEHLPTLLLHRIARNYQRGGYRLDSPFWAWETAVYAELEARTAADPEATQEHRAVDLDETDEFPAYRDD